MFSWVSIQLFSITQYQYESQTICNDVIAYVLIIDLRLAFKFHGILKQKYFLVEVKLVFLIVKLGIIAISHIIL